MDESRKQFEDWCESFHDNPPLGGWDSSRCGDFYYTHHIDVLLCAWKASRAAIENELLSDKRRMDWLVSKAVNVRDPMVYGSHSMFWSQAITDEEDDYYETKLREQIDEAMDAESIRAAGIKVKE